jgi:hypothetical protein
MESTKFYEVLETLRRRDPASPTGFESDRVFAARLGIANKTITLYKRGAIPKAETIQKIVQRGGYSNEDFYKLLANAAGGERQQPASNIETPVYAVTDVTVSGVKGNKAPLFSISVPVALNAVVSRSSLSAVLLSDNDGSCEPRIPRGSVVVYSTGPGDPENQKLYMFEGPNGAYPALLRVRGRQIWRSGINLEDLKTITLKEFEEEVIGVVVMISVLEINIPGIPKQ